MTAFLVVTALFLIAVAWVFFSARKEETYGGLQGENARLRRELDEARAAMNACLERPHPERLPALLEAERRFGEVFLGGDEIRKAIIATGDDHAVPHFARILEDYHGPITLTGGVREALKAGTVEGDYRVQAFKLLVQGLDSESRFGVCQDKIPELLLGLDEEWAVRILRSQEYLTPGHKLFQSALQCLSERRHAVNREWVESWLSRYEGRELEFSEGRDYVEVLKTLHLHDAARAEQLLEKAMNGQKAIRSQAATGLLDVRDLPLPFLHLGGLMDRLGWHALNEVEKTILLAFRHAFRLKYGLEQLHMSPDMERIVEVRRALETLGARHAVAMLDDYNALYGPEGIPKEFEDRLKVIEADDAWIEKLDAIRDRHEYDDVELLALKYELDHAYAVRKRSVISEMLRTSSANGATTNK